MDLEQQLRAALVPISPLPQVRAAVLESLAPTSGGRGTKWWVLTGFMVALAAAAVMLVTWQRDRDAPVIMVDTVPVAVPASESATALPSESGEPVAPTPTQELTSAAPEPAVNPFTVQLLPLKNDAADGARKAAIEATYTAVIEGLRTIPGLKLVVLTQDEVPPDLSRDRPGVVMSTDYRISLEGQIPSPSTAATSKFSLYMIAERAGPDGRLAGAVHADGMGDVAPGCVTPATSDWIAGDSTCADAAGAAAMLLGTLSRSVFPPNPQFQQRLQARLTDQALDPAARLRALVDLGELGRSPGGFGKQIASALRDPAVIRAAIQLASAAREPEIRAQVWYMLRGSRDPSLMQSLTAALGTDLDDDTRVQALGTLAADFVSDPQARMAFETAAVRDPHPMVRALAGRALGGESGWTEYVLASLKDTDRPPAERVEALFHAYGLPSWRRYGAFSADSRILRSLDEGAMRALAEVLPKAAAESDRYAHGSSTLLSDLARMEHPAITDMLLDIVRSEGVHFPRRTAVEAMRRRAADVRVRTELERIAAEDADPEVREVAARPLSLEEKGMRSNTVSLPPRLGVQTDYVKAAPDVPVDLVGKLVVTAMISGAPADRAGLKEGDILLELGGSPITSGPQLIEVLDSLPTGEDVDALISRNGQQMRLTARF